MRPFLVCPTDEERLIFMGRQRFQYGQMVWRSDNGVIYVLYDDGTWQSFADLWREGQAENDPGLHPPEGLLQPVRGFGRVWREELGGPGGRLGWAAEPEQGLDGAVQAWRSASIFRFGPETLVLLDNGTWQRPA